MVDTTPKLVTITEAARLLSASVSTVRRMIREGALTAIPLRTNGQPRIPVAAIEEFIDKQLPS